MFETCETDIRPYPLPGTDGVTVRVAASDYDLQREYNEALRDRKPLRMLQARLIAACIMEDEGSKPAFESKEAVLELMAKPGTARLMQSLLAVALTRNGLKDELPEETEKK